MRKKIESALFHFGFREPEGRKMVTIQLFFLLASLPFWCLGSTGQGLAAGVLLATLNFLMLTRMLQPEFLLTRKRPGLSVLVFYLRLAVIGAVAYICLTAGVSAVWLLAGLSTLFLTLGLWFFSRAKGKM